MVTLDKEKSYPPEKSGSFTRMCCPSCGELRTMPNTDDKCGVCTFGRATKRRPRGGKGWRYRPQPLSNLRRTRKRIGLSQVRLAKASGVDLETVRNHELGRRDVVRSDVAEKLARALEVSVEELLA